MTSRGDTLKSSSGTQQGCPLSNPLFALTMQFISQSIEDIKGLNVKQFYWDDTALVGTPEAVARTAQRIEDLSRKTGLTLNWKKCRLYGTEPIIENCSKISNPRFATEITLNKSLNMIYLKVPIGSNEFVAKWLTNKLIRLKNIIRSISQMPYKHEAYSLLRSCAAECRVTYLMRILPPRQIRDFMQSFDKVLREGFKDILGCSLSDRWRKLAQLPPKFGGMSMRSGITYIWGTTSCFDFEINCRGKQDCQGVEQYWDSETGDRSMVK